MEPTIKTVPAPWHLKGKGYIFLYRFPKHFDEESGNLPAFLKTSFAGGFGSVMLVDYESSEAGGYGELLFIPGKFRFEGKKLDSISKIYVSTEESVLNGRRNWGIPKEKADFQFRSVGRNEEEATVSLGGKTAASFRLRSGSFSFPVSTKLLPFPLVQQYEGKTYFTSFSGSGKGHFCKIEEMKITPSLFPDLSRFSPLAVIRVDPFAITFPEAVIRNGTESNDTI